MLLSAGQSVPIPRPRFRRLRTYAFDPGLELSVSTARANQTTLRVVWEDDLQPGPVGEYLEVIDYDPPSQCFYEPVDLNHPYILAQDGLEPFDGNPKFHQQMVYAVIMTTIRNFERALGRPVIWSPRVVRGKKGNRIDYVQRLRVYPHAMREPNAYYSPEKKALLFGYFPAPNSPEAGRTAGSTVFTCLSHDIIAHETTHAILDGMDTPFHEPSNPDVIAFHEAFADSVALLQHMAIPEALRDQIAKSRGDLAGTHNLLAQMAQQLGWATGLYGALRDALGSFNQRTRRWEPAVPDPTQLARTFEPHERGAILCAAIYEAFLNLFKDRTDELIRLATGGSGVLPVGALQAELVNQLAQHAAAAAQYVLDLCIRALDFCPPTDCTFGEFLAAMITADYDFARDGERTDRIAIMESFLKRGIRPQNVHTVSTLGLRWEEADFDLPGLRELVDALGTVRDRSANRLGIYKQMRADCVLVHRWIRSLNAQEGARIGLVCSEKGPATLARDSTGRPGFEVASARLARRAGPYDQTVADLVIRVRQRRDGFLSHVDQQKADRSGGRRVPDFTFRGGCTLLIDLQTCRPRYCVVKNILSEDRLRQQRAYLSGAGS
ncbi:MAG: hypothetical protein AB9869_11505 [Verrucomicrobiia bacterium]